MNYKLKTWLTGVPLFSLFYWGVLVYTPSEWMFFEPLLSPLHGWVVGIITMTYITITHKETTL